MVTAPLDRYPGTEERLRERYLCPPGTAPRPTGRRLARDAPYPPGHPLAEE